MNDRPIGVFDSGVGGLTVFRALCAALPDEPMVYLGDTARVPYGTRSPSTVERYSMEAQDFLNQHRIKLLVVACNSASSVALDSLVRESDVPVVGVIAPGARRAVEQTRSGVIGVIGTRATVASGAYERAIQALRSDARVESRACPLFVPLAEEGWTDNDVARATAETYLGELREAGVDTLVMGCTHYPLLREVIGATMGAGVELVDSAEAVADEVRGLLADEAAPPLPAGASARRDLFITDEPAPFMRMAERILGPEATRIEQVRLDEY
ncbi:glutamate racemase [Acidobacteria bacterium Mor1]|nr:glutamate racemase [Acidobacteria bacterium Mor1]